MVRERKISAAPVQSVESIVELSDRLTDEVVFGFVGAVGAGVSTTAEMVKNILEKKYGYEVRIIKISDIISKFSGIINYSFDKTKTKDERISELQKIGSKMREVFSKEYLAEKCIEQISIHRLETGGFQGGEEIRLAPRPRRVAHIIDSLKNPAEAQLFREVYGPLFWLFGVFAPEEIRRERLMAVGYSEVEFHRLKRIDDEEGVSHGQNVRKTILDADFFVRNDGINTERLRRVVERYLEIIFNVGVHTPTRDESAMYIAASAASRSACLSRQVGASILSAKSELLGIGANDVPKRGGGLYSIEDLENDNRCYKMGGKICYNDFNKDRLYEEIYSILKKENFLSDKASVNDVRNALKSTDIRNLIEFSRAVHAEMDALISVARGAKQGLVDSTMYVTTFPCHSCARHIVASGITKVIYVEPYPKSLALTLHSDAISVRESDSEKRVLFLQYEGVAPKNMIRLFNNNIERKADGKIIETSHADASPMWKAPLDGFSDREKIVLQRISVQETKARSVDGGELDGKSAG